MTSFLATSNDQPATRFLSTPDYILLLYIAERQTSKSWSPLYIYYLLFGSTKDGVLLWLALARSLQSKACPWGPAVVTKQGKSRDAAYDTHLGTAK